MATSRPSPSPLSRLARSLANNHVCATLGPDTNPAALLKARSAIVKYNRRVIVLVGSGASQDAGLFSSDKAIEALEESNPLPKKVIEKELDRLVSVQKLDPSQFETQILAMSATEHSGTLVRKKLTEIYNRRFMPTFTYEILAHLLKHRFIDAVISFNFDELLDQAISDELKPEEYILILSDGDCPPGTIRSKEPLAKPFYIKLHGTVSHPSTLRFTRDEYYRLPTDIKQILLELIEVRPVDLISIGFDMKSFEFNHIARKASPGSKIFYINLYEPIPDRPLGTNYASYLIPVDRTPGGLSSIFEDFWQRISGHFRAAYSPRNIDRHRLVSQLFRLEREQNEDNAEYLWDRTVVELCLAIAKGKGFVTISDLSAGRCGKYYQLYRNKSQSETKSFNVLCSALGLRDVGYGFVALRLTRTDLTPSIISRKKFEENLPDLMVSVRKQLNKARHALFDSSSRLIQETLLTHYDGDEVEVRAAPIILYDYSFQAPAVIRGLTALKYRTFDLLSQKNQWEHLLVVSETGQWLGRTELRGVIKKRKSRKIYLIAADPSFGPHLCRLYPGQILCVSMPRWDHNRHLSLLLDQMGHEICSIYFTRQRRSNDIVPVFLDVDDSKIVHEYFKAYWIRATERETWVNPERIQSFKLPAVPKS